MGRMQTIRVRGLQMGTILLCAIMGNMRDKKCTRTRDDVATVHALHIRFRDNYDDTLERLNEGNLCSLEGVRCGGRVVDKRSRHAGRK